MGVFDRIKNAIFGKAQAAPVPEPAAAAPQAGAPASSPAQPTAAAKPAAAPASASPASANPASPSPTSKADIEQILNAAVKKSGQKLDWRHSIVDLMKALGMDASLAERKELAAELGYTGDTGDSAKMNMFLHKALMKKLSENGGKVPADLLD
jgi:pyruvate/2-oxoglutarate dehydrogenase complex dihydrolipoamide acyltransferase (E2) component